MNGQDRKLDNFIKTWSNKGSEVADKVTYWNTLLSILGVPQEELDNGSYIQYEKKINWKSSKFHGAIDGYIPKTKVLIEQKSFGVDLSKPESRPNGGDKELITPFKQAKRYDDNLPADEKANFFVLSNFAEIWVYDRRTNLDAKPVKLSLSDLKKQLHVLDFMVKIDTANVPLEKEKEVSLAAGELVSEMYKELDTIFAQYKDIDSNEAQRSINALCVRLVFCLYAEDAGLFDKKEEFYNYLKPIAPNRMGIALRKLFEILDTKEEDRIKKDPFFKADNPELAKFPYVNGGMFHDQSIIIPPFTQKLKDILLNKASRGFDWSDISPTIFGAVFESTLNPETRRQGGMHYTSVENIHKVIDPLFLNDLKAELQKIKDTYVQPSALKEHARKFQDKLASLTFLDPACGSGNFLTETYLSLRKLENEAIRIETHGESLLETGGEADKYIHVSIQQFFGIEINDFAVSVAKTALWIAEDQMMKQTQDLIYGAKWHFLPLKTYTHIHEGNALKIDWNKVVPNYACSYIIGNPPFVGARWMDRAQKNDLKLIFNGWKRIGDLDYVSGWYKKASDYVKNKKIRCAYVSTNSITQGESVAILWKPLFESGLHIDYAYRTFVWNNEATTKAKVHCVIIGFSRYVNKKPKFIYWNKKKTKVTNINGYLLNAANVFIERRNKPLCSVPSIRLGGQAIDGGYLILSQKEKNKLISSDKRINQYIRPYMMGKDFINRKSRYCLWLVNSNLHDLRIIPEIKKRIKLVKEFRLKSHRKSTLRAANVPYLFASVYEAKNNYIAIPKVSSKNRRYIPMDYLNEKIIPGDKIFVMSNATLFDFGILMSNVHMSWVRAVSGRLKSDYSYSNTIVYNNFPWPNSTQKQKNKVGKTAQKILDARKLYPNDSLADLYDSDTMPPELLKAHQANDKAVMQAYGMKPTICESEIVAQLFKMYEQLIQK